MFEKIKEFMVPKKLKELQVRLQEKEGMITSLLKQRGELQINVCSMLNSLEEARIKIDSVVQENRKLRLNVEQLNQREPTVVVKNARSGGNKASQYKRSLDRLHKETDVLLSIEPKLQAFAKAFQNHSIEVLNEQVTILGQTLVQKGFANTTKGKIQ